MTTPHVGVLALQGAFREHKHALERLGARVTEVRLPRDLDGLHGLVIPGGESTTIGKLLVDYDLRNPIRDFHARGGALWGTCAGAILLAREVHGAPKQFGGVQPGLDLMDITVRRNAFGRQVDSFEEHLHVQGLTEPVHAVFIRAPIIERAGEGVDVLARHGDDIVLAQQGRLLACSFHPELGDGDALHRHFLTLAQSA
ncbi:pyridoxal 5'-phosphate synthase glutaminase subunit PdxT [Deinococcus maricopensis]|uniref:Pyridoxal 5'-phosphate synthase subunit PdxT n=1 Tax=Deinococcus maricopensis (strain DSM 21211 / LMG 22137 / NRRL B-23946 / LB-34) TaxID=709986 RepID=E8U8Y3_DEIML|nr:pyridoxal 5'-phosphate synthase glutaminase subunit PdxT [Deinococcus maricopensis]ADV67522.1 Glutamine amidotransferase subunit pdxT [Deinococcus maricopensis DSM 21211]